MTGRTAVCAGAIGSRDWNRRGRYVPGTCALVGAAIVFDVPDNDTYHTRLTEWLTYVPAHFDVYPLVTPVIQEQLLRDLSDG